MVLMEVDMLLDQIFTHTAEYGEEQPFIKSGKISLSLEEVVVPSSNSNPC